MMEKYLGLPLHGRSTPLTSRKYSWCQFVETEVTGFLQRLSPLQLLYLHFFHMRYMSKEIRCHGSMMADITSTSIGIPGFC